MRKDLLSWQIKDYSLFHQSNINLAVHIATFPLFWIGILAIPAALLFRDASYLRLAPLALVAFAAQGAGHKFLEGRPPHPFLSPVDLVSRFFAEQFVTFPRWFFVVRHNAAEAAAASSHGTNVAKAT